MGPGRVGPTCIGRPIITVRTDSSGLRLAQPVGWLAVSAAVFRVSVGAAASIDTILLSGLTSRLAQPGSPDRLRIYICIYIYNITAPGVGPSSRQRLPAPTDAPLTLNIGHQVTVIMIRLPSS